MSPELLATSINESGYISIYVSSKQNRMPTFIEIWTKK